MISTSELFKILKKRDQVMKSKEIKLDPISDLAREYMIYWAECSLAPSKNREKVSRYIKQASDSDLIVGYAHLMKFDAFPDEDTFHFIKEKINANNLAETKDFLKSKQRMRNGKKVN